MRTHPTHTTDTRAVVPRANRVSHAEKVPRAGAARRGLAWLLIGLTGLAGCQPSRPFYLTGGGELGPYLDAATEIEYPDVNHAPLADAALAHAPLTPDNFDQVQYWDLTLEDAISIALQNSKVVRIERSAPSVPQQGAGGSLQENILSGQVSTVYDTAIVETEAGVNPHQPPIVGNGAIQLFGQGVEDALSDFDAQFTSSVFWSRTERAQNVDTGGIGGAFTPSIFEQDTAQFQMEIAKKVATGGVFSFRHQIDYDRNNRPIRAVSSDWTAVFEVEGRHPLLRGRGEQVNRAPILIARIRADVELVQFEANVRNLVFDVEKQYWNLHYAYRLVQSNKSARDTFLRLWRKVNDERRFGLETLHAEALARARYFDFRARLEASLSDLQGAEANLRYRLGLSPTDGRLIRPVEDPLTAKVRFDWNEIREESLFRTAELRARKWEIKSAELELLAARNRVLPQLNAIGLYRWVGLGDELWALEGNGRRFPQSSSRAFEELAIGDYQEFQFGLEFLPPRIGLRRELASVRNAQLKVARAHAVLEDAELAVVHNLTHSLREAEKHYLTSHSYYNVLLAEEEELFSIGNLYLEGKKSDNSGRPVFDILVEANQRRADAEQQYYNAICAYNNEVAHIHFRKGSLLEYNNIYLREGPWPSKAYHDAREEARRRGASWAVNYGWTRPRVISQGPVTQFTPGGDFGTVPEAGQAPGAAPPRNTPPDETPADEELPPGDRRRGPPAGDVETGIRALEPTALARPAPGSDGFPGATPEGANLAPRVARPPRENLYPSPADTIRGLRGGWPDLEPGGAPAPSAGDPRLGMAPAWPGQVGPRNMALPPRNMGLGPPPLAPTNAYPEQPASAVLPAIRFDDGVSRAHFGGDAQGTRTPRGSLNLLAPQAVRRLPPLAAEVELPGAGPQ